MAGEEGKVAVNELRDKLNFGRKLTVQLMEYFDRTGFLRRKGNDHILRDKDTFDLQVIHEKDTDFSLNFNRTFCGNRL